MKTSEILRAAKARLTPETWGKGNSLSAVALVKQGKLCAAMAIGTLDLFGEGNPVYEQQALTEAMELLGKVTCGNMWQIPNWNDRPERTLQDVLDGYDAAIEIAEALEVEQPVMVLA